MWAEEWEEVVGPVGEHLQAVEHELRRELVSSGAPTEQQLLGLVDAGGKRIRPLLLLLAARCGRPEWSKARRAACAVEMVHTASLLHDDVVDDAPVRRGAPTLRLSAGTKRAVLAGDVLFSRALEVCLEENLAEAALLIARAARAMAQAEARQTAREGDLHWDPHEYVELARQKTGSLFAAASEAGAHIGGLETGREAFSLFGFHLGTAFQVVDDVLDYVPDRSGWGKKPLADLRQRRATLPLLLALKMGVVVDWPVASEASRILQESGALDEALGVARNEVQAARKCLPEVPHDPTRTALSQLCELVMRRLGE